MKVQLTIKNYRCFVGPATVEISKGLTAFIGVNNAGKSTLMRFLLEMRPTFAKLSGPGTHVINFLQGNEVLSFLHVTDPDEVFSNLNLADLEFWFDFIYDEPISASQLTRAYFTVSRTGLKCKMALMTTTQFTVGSQGVRYAGNRVISLPSNNDCDLSLLFETAQNLNNTLYIGPFRNAINVGGMQSYFDIQIGDTFIKQFRNYKTGPSRQMNKAIIDLIDSIRRIFEFFSLSVEPSFDDKSLHIVVNNKPYKQDELGSGLLQFIIVLANASTLQRRLILIDEPELNLHPRLQLDFLTTIASYAKDGVWFATHSVGLARSAADRIYSVIRRSDSNSAVRPFEATPRLAEFLGEMSFSSHQEIGFEKVLLVEGPTEVKVIQQFLRKMGKDHKIVMLPLHGHFPKLDEFIEVLRLTDKLACLIDSERDAAEQALSPVRQRFLDLCAAHNIPARALDRRATENYFPEAVIKNVFGPQYRALGAYERFHDVRPSWSKTENWRAAAAMDLADIMQTDLGRFLEAL